MYLHLGQKRGKSSRTVCGRICVLVFPPHLGQRSQSSFDAMLSVMGRHPGFPSHQGAKGRVPVKGSRGKAGDLPDGLIDAETEAR